MTPTDPSFLFVGVLTENVFLVIAAKFFGGVYRISTLLLVLNLTYSF